MSERTSWPGIIQLVRSLFRQGAAERAIAAEMPKLNAAMHLDPVFTFVGHELVIFCPEIMDQVHSISVCPAARDRGVTAGDHGTKPFAEVAAQALNLPKLA